jgi:ADP-L-glycero-D-manno-heptose 6-epimerase
MSLALSLSPSLDLNSTQPLIIVTGGAGFIGSVVVKLLNRKGLTNILIVDRLGSAGDKWRNLVGLRYDAGLVAPEPFFAAIKQDLDSSNILTNKLPSDIRKPLVQAVIHLGACSATTEKNADYLYSNNYLNTVSLYRWTQQYLNEPARFVYASSAATYGLGDSDGLMMDYSDLDYLESLRPLNMYGLSKHLFDLEASRQGWLRSICGLKFFNVYGPNENHKTKDNMQSGAYRMYETLISNRPIELFSMPDGGVATRDFLYVLDAAQVVIFAALDRSHTMNGLYNVGTGFDRSWEDLATSVGAAVDVDLEGRVLHVPMPQHLIGKYQQHTRADITKLYNIGYPRAFFTLEEGVSHYIRGYLATGKRFAE